MSDRLAEILATTHAEVARRKREPLPASSRHEPRGFHAALKAKAATGAYALIAEIKKASPSKGLIRADFDPAAHARAYAEGAAACLSVLTDEPWFQGSLEHLSAVRDVVDLPILRKDFMVDPWQVAEARHHGADAILLIVAALDDVLIAEIEATAFDHALDVLIEVHDEPELDRALKLKSRLIGINNRDLKTFQTDSARAWQIAKRVPAGYTIVSESGIATHTDLEAAAEHGIRTFLVGESLMRQPDLVGATRKLLTGA